jgi:hypothetical protein
MSINEEPVSFSEFVRQLRMAPADGWSVQIVPEGLLLHVNNRLGNPRTFKSPNFADHNQANYMMFLISVHRIMEMRGKPWFRDV